LRKPIREPMLRRTPHFKQIPELNAGNWKASRDDHSGLEFKMTSALQCVVKKGVAPSSWEAAPLPKSQSISWCVNLMRISYAIQLWCLEHPQTRNLSNKQL
jgi:hypothetical protein